MAKRRDVLDSMLENFRQAKRKGKSDEEALDGLLTFLEEKGMKPPGYLKPIPFYDGKQYPLIPGDFKNENDVWCTPGIQEWEDETKET